MRQAKAIRSFSVALALSAAILTSFGVGHAAKGKTSDEHVYTDVDLQLELMSYADRYAAVTAQASDDIARLGHGGLCLECEECRFPVCPFGKS